MQLMNSGHVEEGDDDSDGAGAGAGGDHPAKTMVGAGPGSSAPAPDEDLTTPQENALDSLEDGGVCCCEKTEHKSLATSQHCAVSRDHIFT